MSRSGWSQPSCAVVSSSSKRNVTMSMALKLEPRWPEPARLTAVSAFARAMSASSASRSSRGTSASRTRSNSLRGTSASSVTARQASTSMPRERRLARREQRLGAGPVLLPVDAQSLVPVQKQRQTGLPAERPVRDHPRPGDLECARLDVDGRQRLELAVVPRHVEV